MPSDAAFVGDDLPDLGVLRAVGLAGRRRERGERSARAAASVQLTRTGGHGAVREFAELLLTARGEWDELVDDYVATRSVGGLEVLR